MDHKPALGLPFVLGLTAFIFLPLGGRISVAELLSVVLFVAWSFRPGFLAGRRAGICVASVTIFIGLYFGSVIGPAHNSGDYITAVANYGMLAVLTCTLGSIFSSGGIRAVKSMLLGAAVGQFAGLVLSRTADSVVDPWKFGLGWAVTVIVLVWIDGFGTPRMSSPMSVSVIAVLTVVHLVLDSRSIAVFVALCGVAITMQARSGIRKMVSKSKFFVIGVLLAAAIVVFAAAYQSLVLKGVFGLDAAEKYINQNGDFGVFFGARKEIPLLWNSWMHSPIFGWGPSPEIDPGVAGNTVSWFAIHGYNMNYGDYSRLFLADKLPLHSVILGLMVQCGLFGLPFIFIVIRLIIVGLRKSFTVGGILPVFLVLTGASHFFLSPLGDTTRFPLAVALAFGMMSVLKSGRVNKNSGRDERLFRLNLEHYSLYQVKH